LIYGCDVTCNRSIESTDSIVSGHICALCISCCKKALFHSVGKLELWLKNFATMHGYCSYPHSIRTGSQWRLQGRANPGIARVFLHTIYHVICLKPTAHARMYIYRVCRCDVARGHGLGRSQPRERRGTKRPQSFVFARVTTSLCRRFWLTLQRTFLKTF